VSQRVLGSVIIKLAGGIGNQLFQTAFGLSVSKRFSVPAYINTESYVNYEYFNAPEILKLNFDRSTLSECEQAFDTKTTYLLHERTITSIDQLACLPSDCKTLILEGYWQRESFIDPTVVDFIYSKLTNKYKDFFKDAGNDQISVDASRIAVHIRRRDYAHMGIVKNEYYYASLRLFCQVADTRRISLYSDEPNASLHLLRKFGYTDIELVKSGDDFKDLYALSRHRYIVMANSTYSWWGGKFGEMQRAKFIIRPDPWLTIDTSINPCPDRWISVPNSVCSGTEFSASVSERLYTSISETANKGGYLSVG